MRKAAAISRRGIISPAITNCRLSERSLPKKGLGRRSTVCRYAIYYGKRGVRSVFMASALTRRPPKSYEAGMRFRRGRTEVRQN